MMTLRAVFLAVVFLLVSATTIAAECAWLLWQEVGSFGPDLLGQPHVFLLAASPSYQECERRRISKIKTLLVVTDADRAPNDRRVTAKEKGGIVMITRERDDGTSVTQIWNLTCLPDTVEYSGRPKTR